MTDDDASPVIAFVIMDSHSQPYSTASRSVAATVANREIHSPPVPTQFIYYATHWFAESDFFFVRRVLVIRWRLSWQGRRNE